MSFKNEKYDHIQNFWKLDNVSESQLFWQLEKDGFTKCDINVLHAIRKWDNVVMWRYVPKGKKEFIWSNSGLPGAIQKHVNKEDATPQMVFDSIQKLLKTNLIKYDRKLVEEPKGKRKFTFYFDVDIKAIREHIASLSTSKLF